MKIEIKSYGNTYSIETQNDDLDINEILNHIYGLLVQLSFHNRTIISGMIEFVESKEE